MPSCFKAQNLFITEINYISVFKNFIYPYTLCRYLIRITFIKLRR